ncbi:MAG: ADP-ribosylglycohydrolase YegU [uncultured Propionibacteriaceae bacterium]|uniref:ADP-ribosylglycohydrolase YegU n=1 Tax=uncultured Propionibacteriaceae bacterium TaxID=257457 RepID=A0A6J4N1N0_9ACTN|nr:MAG: ADP-ribosylglycohydrolase YegU [uncultured Propionibacteriaceae bacterium]
MSPESVTPAADRARAALHGLAVGDALGMPTQLMARDQIAARFGVLTGFRAAQPDHPLAAGLPAGSVTDDTEQALLLARLLIDGSGHVDPATFAGELVAWEQQMRAKGSSDLLGPSTSRAVAAVLSGVPVQESGRFGVTNGAAMRVAPVGLLMPTTDLGALLDRVVEASSVTHNTGVALAGAAAIAAAVSAGIEGASPAQAATVAVQAARLGAQRGHWVAGANVAARISWAISLADPADREQSLDAIYRLVGTSLATQESVPAAFGICAVFPDDPWLAMTAAASLGGDTDTVAAMVGALSGACAGMAGLPDEAVRTVTEVNDLDLDAVAAGLLALRGVP